MKPVSRVFMIAYVVAMFLAAFAGHALASAVMDTNVTANSPPVESAVSANAPPAVAKPKPAVVAQQSASPVAVNLTFIGKIDRMEAGKWIVSGRTIAVAGTALVGSYFKRGDMVSISGARQADGSITANTVEVSSALVVAGMLDDQPASAPVAADVQTGKPAQQAGMQSGSADDENYQNDQDDQDDQDEYSCGTPSAGGESDDEHCNDPGHGDHDGDHSEHGDD